MAMFVCMAVEENSVGKCGETEKKANAKFGTLTLQIFNCTFTVQFKAH